MLIAIDTGHGYCKGMGPRGSRWSAPSWLVPDTGDGMVASMEFLGTPRPITVAWNGAAPRSYWWGSDARRGARVILAPDKGHTPRTWDLTLISGVLTVQSAGDDPAREPWDLAIGVPLGWYSSQKDALAEALRGQGQVMGVPVTVRQVAVFPQGMAAVLANAPPDRPGLYGVIDIGYGTTEYLIVEVQPGGRVRVTADPAGTWEMGMRTISQRVANRVVQQTGVMVDPEDVDHVDTLTIRGEDLDLRDWRQDAVRWWQLVLQDHLDAVWHHTLPRMAACWVVGGGADALSGVTVNGMPLTILPDARWANVTGYWNAMSRRVEAGGL
ncbi:ParM/StbA family protein [Sulfobacillus thermosulfidooxidans]|uniref:ParM/StbA family protein n=1 Tax=Sulfobacillus thermosulfidooxidans TaxID=28034 RepID=UPI0006B5A4CA|nr:ParM/StbA family protein [Sulfobacillus thermosulfidooxidans]